jgi:hypothetical protein
MAGSSLIHLGGFRLTPRRIVLSLGAVWGSWLGFSWLLVGDKAPLLALGMGVVCASIFQGFFWSRGALADLQRREVIRWSGPFFPVFWERLPFDRFRHVSVGSVVQENLSRHSLITGHTPTSSSIVVRIEETHGVESIARWDPYAPQPEVILVHEGGTYAQALRRAQEVAVLLGLTLRDDFVPSTKSPVLDTAG